MEKRMVSTFVQGGGESPRRFSRGRAAFAGFLAAAAFLPAVSMAADVQISEDRILSADLEADTLTINAGKTLWLNGHTATATKLDGSGTIAGTPEGYALLEYIESTDGGGQYIDTGILPTSEVKFEADVAYLFGSYTPLLSASNPVTGSDTVSSKTYGVWAWAGKWAVMYSGDTKNSSAVPSARTRVKLVAAWKQSEQTLSINGTSVLSEKVNTDPAAVNYTMYLPGRNKGGTAVGGGFRIYSAKIYNPQNTLVRNYIPAKRLSDGAIGLYDLQSKEFFENKSETPFATGGYEMASGGELHLNLTDNFTNSSIAFAGTMKFVKGGVKTFTTSKAQTYTGGTLVRQGAVKSNNALGFGAEGSAFEVASTVENGEVIAGEVFYNYDTVTSDSLANYHVTIAGDGPPGDDLKGALEGYGTTQNGWAKPFMKSLTLSADASVRARGGDGICLRAGRNTAEAELPVRLNGHTLTARGGARMCLAKLQVADEGTIVDAMTGTGPDLFHLQGYSYASNATFRVEENAWLNGDGGVSHLTCSNLVFAGKLNGATVHINVLHRYEQLPSSPAANYPYLMLGDTEHTATTLDISGFSVASPFDSSRVTFSAGTTVTVQLGAMEFEEGNRVVAWTDGKGPDASVQFVPAGTGWTAEGRKIKLVARTSGSAQGLYVATTESPAYAVWNSTDNGWDFFMADGTAYAGEWTGGVTQDMQVRFGTYAQYQGALAANVTPAAFIMTALPLDGGAGEIDLSGLQFGIGETLSSIDLQGRTVVLPGSAAEGQNVVSVTSSLSGGALAVYVPENATVQNTALNLSGDVKLLKRGAGTLSCMVSQSYTGGTVVQAGTLCPADAVGDGRYEFAGDTFHAFGTGMIDVMPNAVFDVRGNYAYTNVCLKGGTLANSLRKMEYTDRPGLHVASLADADESYLDMSLSGDTKCAAIYGGSGAEATDLGGKTLKVTVWDNLTVRTAFTNGTLNVKEKNGWIVFDTALDMSTAKIEMNNALKLYADIDVRDYEHIKATHYLESTGKFKVHGRFIANSPYFPNCSLLDGATLDLSKLDATFTAYCTSWQNKKFTVGFDSGASTIYVETGARTLAAGDKLATWETQPSSAIVFRLVQNGTANPDFSAEARADGLYVVSAAIPAFAEWNVDESKWDFLTAEGDAFPREWNGGVTSDIAVRYYSWEQYNAMDKTVPAKAFRLASGFILPSGGGVFDMSACMDSIASDVTIDLNGATLKLPAGIVGGSTPFTVTSGAQGGVLDIFVAENGTITNTSVAIAGGANTTVWKTGLGKLVMEKANQGFGANGEVSMIVKEGRAAKTDKRYQCGAQYSKIKVLDGAQFDFYGRSDWDYDYEIAGSGPDGLGALVNTDTSTFKSAAAAGGESGYFRDIVLDGDATIGGTGDFGLIYYNYGARTAALNGNTLTFVNQPDCTRIYAGNLSYTGEGTVAIASGATLATYAREPNGRDCTLQVDGILYQDGVAVTPLKSLKFGANGYYNTDKTSTGNNAFTVRDTYKPNAKSTSTKMTSPKVILGTAQDLRTTLNLGNFPEAAFNGQYLTFAANTRVTVDLSAWTVAQRRARAIAEDNYLVTWPEGSGPADTVSFVLDDTSATAGYELETDAGGLRLMPRRGFTIRIAEGESPLVVPFAWVQAKLGKTSEAEQSEVEPLLAAAGANGIPYWQSYVLGLEPANADSVVLCEAADGEAAAGVVNVRVKNVSVPGDLAHFTVRAYLERKTGDSDWQSVASKTIAPGAAVISGEMAEASSLDLFRVRIGIE